MGTILLLFGFLLIAYTFVGYPMCLRIAAKAGAGDSNSDSHERPDPQEPPEISIVATVFNEAHQIDELLRSLTALDYPEDRRQILIVSDGSTDGTDEAIRRWADRDVEFLRVSPRVGKTAAENQAIAHLRSDIVVSTDASVRLAPNSLLPLISPFRDPQVGVTTGVDVSVSGLDADTNLGEAGYVDYEMRVRALETLAGGIVGASGSLFAARRAIFAHPFAPEVSRDFGSVLLAQLEGFRAVTVEEARCFVPRTATLKQEYARKVRTVAGGIATLRAFRQTLNPVRHPLFSWKLWSHKIARWLLPLAGLSLLLGLSTHAAQSPAAATAVVVILAMVLVGWVGIRQSRTPGSGTGIVSLPAYFLIGNLAVVHGIAQVLSGRHAAIWEPTRRQ